jgi:hypothetical protein
LRKLLCLLHLTNISILHAHLILWLWSQHPQEVDTLDDKDGEELKAIVK